MLFEFSNRIRSFITEVKIWLRPIQGILESFSLIIKKQENCKHEYVKKTKTTHFQCKLCNHIKKLIKLKN
jgi:hypothetical protein